jgi:hypothetical protein
MKGQLYGAEFYGQPLNSGEARSLIRAADRLLAQAAALSLGSARS